VRAAALAAAYALRRDLSGRAARPGDGGRPGGRVQGGRHRDGRARWGNAPRAGGRGGATALGRPGVGPGPERRRTVPRPRPAARREGSPYQRKVGEPGAMPQFSGHWYSGRAARLVFVEAALVAIALSISGQSAHGWRELAALMAVAACVPAALYLADLYDPQIMRNDRSRGASVLKALGFAALAAAIVGLIGGGTVPRGALIEIIGVASVGVLLARAALIARPDEQGHNRVLVIGAGQRAAEIERIVRTEAYGEYEVAGKLDPSVDLSEPQQVAAAGGGEVIAATGARIEAKGQPSGEMALSPSPEIVPSSQLIVGPGSAPAHIQGPIAEAKVAARATAEEKPLAAVVQLPTAPHGNPTIAVTARTLTDAVGDLRVDTVVIASDERRSRLPVEEFIRLRLAGVTVLPAQRFAERVLRRIPIALLRPSDLAIGEGLNSPVRTAAKRVFDLVMSSILVVCTAPLLAVLAILIKLDSEGPVFYFQERVGRGG